MDNDTAALGAALGVFMPIAISLVQQPSWSARVQSGVAALMCIGAGTLTAFVAGDFNLPTAGATVTAVLVASAAAYQGYWKRAGLHTGTSDSPAAHGPPMRGTMQ